MGVIYQIFLMGTLIYAVQGQGGRTPGLPRRRLDPETMALMAELAALENKLARLGIKKERSNFGGSTSPSDNMPTGGNFGRGAMLGNQNNIQRRMNNQQPFPPPGLDSLLPSNSRRNNPPGLSNIISGNNQQQSSNTFETTPDPNNIQPLTNDFAQLMRAMGGNGLARQHNMLQTPGGNGLRLRDNAPSTNSIAPTSMVPSNDIFTPGLGGNPGGSLSSDMLQNSGGNALGNFMPSQNSGSNPNNGLSSILGANPPRMPGGLSMLTSRNGPPSPPGGNHPGRKPSAGPSGGPMGGINPLLAGFATRNQMADALDTHMDNMADYIEFMQNRNRQLAMLGHMNQISGGPGASPQGRQRPGANPPGMDMAMLGMLG